MAQVKGVAILDLIKFIKKGHARYSAKNYKKEVICNHR